MDPLFFASKFAHFVSCLHRCKLVECNRIMNGIHQILHRIHVERQNPMVQHISRLFINFFRQIAHRRLNYTFDFFRYRRRVCDWQCEGVRYCVNRLISRFLFWSICQASLFAGISTRWLWTRGHKLFDSHLLLTSLPSK